MKKISKQEISHEIKETIKNFCKEYLTPELEGYALKLLDTVQRSRKLDVLRGKSEIWAASLIYVIARLNFLFDRYNEPFITPEIICNFFNTKKSTIGNKATLIEKACKVSNGDERFCPEEISSMFEFVETAEGFIIPKTMLLGTRNSKPAGLIEKRIQNSDEKIQREKELRDEKRRKIAEEKKRRMNKNQLNLFDDF